MPGHTRGHAAVAVEAGDRWILHAGDAFYHHGTLDGRASVPTILNVQERAIAFDYAQVRDNHRRLAELHAQRQPELDIICAHDPTMFQRMSGKL